MARMLFRCNHICVSLFFAELYTSMQLHSIPGTLDNDYRYDTKKVNSKATFRTVSKNTAAII
jgi:hypothetical protein